MKWNEMIWYEMKWNEMKWNEMKWNEMKRNEIIYDSRREVEDQFVRIIPILFNWLSDWLFYSLKNEIN